ncbi:hypothetical protein HMPREF1583_01324 [Gardnerella vaginalis JCP8151B]|nr:hypothetical protein HMPREF1583_01324 [Gardnerella vaginalis JCP8151B]
MQCNKETSKVLIFYLFYLLYLRWMLLRSAHFLYLVMQCASVVECDFLLELM